MSAAPAAAPLDVARARRLTAQLREALAGALHLLHEVHAGQAWKALGYATWEAYCDAELPELAQLRLPLEQRRAVVAELRGRGMSTRAIAKPLGLSVGTVHADVTAAGVQLATVTSLDGRQRPAAAPQKRSEKRTPPLVDRIVGLLAAEPAGLDVFEVTKRLRVRQSQASGALCRLAAARRVDYVAPARRGQVGRYLVGRIEP